MVGDGEQRFLAQPQAFALHRRRDHFKGFARADFMGQQRVSAVQHMGDGVELMLPQGDLRVDAAEHDMPSIILAGPDGVEQLIVLLLQGLPPLGVFPYPVPKSVLDGLLFLLGQGGGVMVQNAAFLAVRVLDGIIDSHIAEVQSVLQDVIGVEPVRAIGGVGGNIIAGYSVFAGDVPFPGIFREIHMDFSLLDRRRFEQLIHKLLDIALIQPGGSQAQVDLRGSQVLGLGGFQGLHVGAQPVFFPFGQRVQHGPGSAQFLPHVPGQVFISGNKGKAVHILQGPILAAGVSLALNIPENHAGQLRFQFRLRFPGELGHIGHIHSGLFPDRDGQGFTGGVHMSDRPVGLDGPLGEHIRFALQPPVIVQHLQRAEQKIGAVSGKGQRVLPIVDKAVLFRESVIQAVEGLPLLLDGVFIGVLHLKVDQPMHTVPQLHHAHDAAPGRGAQIGLCHHGGFPVV